MLKCSSAPNKSFRQKSNHNFSKSLVLREYKIRDKNWIISHMRQHGSRYASEVADFDLCLSCVTDVWVLDV